MLHVLAEVMHSRRQVVQVAGGHTGDEGHQSQGPEWDCLQMPGADGKCDARRVVKREKHREAADEQAGEERG